MNKKNLIKRIQDESERVEIPDLRQETLNVIKLTRYTNEKTVTNNRFTLKFVLGFACIVLLALVIFILLIGNNNSTNNSVSSSRKAYGIQAATLFNFASSYSNDLSLDFSQDECEEIALMLDEYMLLIEEVSQKEEIIYSLTELTEGNYRYVLEVTMKLNGESSSYIMYFNESAMIPEYDDLDEVSSTIEGYVVHNNQEFKLTGKKEVEGRETEVELKMYLSNDNSKYIVVNQEIENRENEYEYKYFESGREIKSFELSCESGIGYKEIELEIAEGSSETSLDVLYYRNRIVIEFEMPKYSGEVTATVENGKYHYNFGNYIVSKDKRTSNLL